MFYNMRNTYVLTLYILEVDAYKLVWKENHEEIHSLHQVA